MRLTLILCLVLGVQLLSSTAEGMMYSYVDESGRLHFTNVPGDSRYREMPVYKQVRRAAARARFNRFIQAAAKQYRLDPELIKAVIKVESDFNPSAVSKKGAMGLMQLMPDTAQEMGVASPFEPEENIRGGSRYLRKLTDLFDGDLRLVLAAYNAGPSRVLALNRVPRIAETEKYVKRVLWEYGNNQRQRLAGQ
jgi:soluble lytic murein transglycosylase-like protein